MFLDNPKMLREVDIIDPAIEAHFAVYSSFSGISTSLHTHNFYELFLIRNGAVQHIVNQVTQHLQSGVLVFIRPTDRHYYQQAESEDCQLLNLALPVRVVHSLMDYLGDDFAATRLLESPLPCGVQLDAASHSALWEQLDHWNSMAAYSHVQARLELRSLLVGIFTRYFPVVALEATSTGIDWLDTLCIAMRQPEHFSVGVERMQMLARCSPEHLARSMRRHLQTTPTDFVNGLRLDFAAKSLAQNDIAIAHIALEAGFENLSHFYHLFQKRFHTSPMHYRNTHRKTVIP